MVEPKKESQREAVVICECNMPNNERTGGFQGHATKVQLPALLMNQLAPRKHGNSNAEDSVPGATQHHITSCRETGILVSTDWGIVGYRSGYAGPGISVSPLHP
jgi:hypothetical protein